jgi:hypothetical protein
VTFPHPRCRGSLLISEKYAADRPLVESVLSQIDASVDLLEPFHRIHDAMTEARKMGVMSRAA